MKTIRTARRILDTVREVGGVTPSQIAERHDLATSTAHHYLDSLATAGFLVNKSGTYRLSLLFLYFGGHILSDNPAYTLIEEKVSSLATKTGERAQFIVEEEGRAVYLFVETESKDAVRTDARMGKITDLHATAAGKAILAALSEERIETIIRDQELSQHTENTITDPATLRTELEQIRVNDIAFNDEERITKQRAVGVAIEGPSGHVTGAFSVSGPTHRLYDEKYTEEIPTLLLGVSDEVELNLTYQ